MPATGLPALTLHDRAIGLMLGLAVGDALGAPFQGMKSAHIYQVAGRVEDYVDGDKVHADAPQRWVPRGLHTAPTQLALAVGDAMIGESAPDGARRALAELIGDDPARGALRGHPRRIRLIGQIAQGEATIPNPADANMDALPAVAAAPLAMKPAVAGEGDPAVHAWAIASLLTRDFRSAAAAAAAVRAACELLSGAWDARDCGAEAARSLAAWTRDAEDRMASAAGEMAGAGAPETRHAVSETLRALAAAFAERNDDLARRSILAEAARHEPGIKMDDPQAPFAPANLAWALYLTLRARGFDRAVCEAVNGGRETSAMGALVGAFCGARLGVGAIPAAWREGLAARAFLERRAEAYAAGDWIPMGEARLIDAEREWTNQVETGRKTRMEAMAEKQKRVEAKRPAKKPRAASPSAAPPTTYARGGQPQLDGASPLDAKKFKIKRDRKRIEWKEDRRRKQRREK